MLFDYYSYVDTGSGAFRLSSTANGNPSLTAPGSDTAVSNGSFTGSGGNTINWTVTSSIPDNQTAYVNRIEFDAVTGSLGNLTYYQYLDEDVFSVNDDVLFTRGSTAAQDFELFTLDGATGIGVSQSGAYAPSQGLSNARFIGWAADKFDDIQPRLRDGSQAVSPTGVIDTADLPQTNSALLDSTVRGPNDVVSVMAWLADAGATDATVVSTLGGVTDGGLVGLPEPGNFEFTVAEGETVVQSLDVRDDNGRPLGIVLLRQGAIDGPHNVGRLPSYSLQTRTWTWDTTDTPEGVYEMNFNIQNAAGQFDTGSIVINVVPEPTSLALLGVAGLGLAMRRRR